MIKTKKIDELISGKVADILTLELTKSGFKYLKSKNNFIKKHNEIEYCIQLRRSNSCLFFNEDTAQLFFRFSIRPNVSIPGYTKWLFDFTKENYGNEVYASNSVTSEIELSFDDFDFDDFYTCTASQNFKNNVTRLLSNNKQEDVVPLDELLNVVLPKIVSELEELSDIQKIFEKRKYPLAHAYLLFYGGYTDQAYSQLDKIYENYISDIEEDRKKEKPDNQLLRYFSKFISEAKKIAGKEYVNPYDVTVSVLEPKNESIRISDKTCFKECLRLNVEYLNIRYDNHIVNRLGEVLLIYNDTRVFKVASDGKILIDTEIEIQPGFRKPFSTQARIVEGSDEFCVNNYVFKGDNTILLLEIPKKVNKKKKPQSSDIIHIAYIASENQYAVLYEKLFLLYSDSGIFEKGFHLGDDYQSNRIITSQKWIINTKRYKAIVIKDLEGNTLGKYEVAHGNDCCEFSPDYNYMLCFSYSTKSQFYNLKNGSKSTLWAHPTFVKGYKETMYNDTHANFGVVLAKFSPDGSYIIGSADHSKYVAWKLPEQKRIELIPQAEVIRLLKPGVTSVREGDVFVHKEKKPEIVELEGTKYLNNRANYITEILFFENGDLFATEISAGDLLLIWDRDFNNIAYMEMDGGIRQASEDCLSKKTKKEIIIFRKE